ncbi:MAG: type II secretion system F family protein [Planctomycetes bacterium]|nr:type II secretion system F family protein [Planctomycetota bacterium]
MDMSAIYYIVTAVVLALGLFYFLAHGSEGSGKTGAKANDLKPGESPFQRDVRKRVDKLDQKEQMRQRLIQAGFYGRNAFFWMSASKILSFVVPLLVALGVSTVTKLPIKTTGIVAVAVAIAGIIGPSFVLDKLKGKRQRCIRRAIPDALDILSICLEAGMSLPSSLARVSQELATAHPELALELAIVDRETRMGRGVGESMRSLADRFDLEELRSMSTVIVQAEKYGSSLSDAMEVFAASMRQKRMYAAETLAQQAVAKILIPTVICILPALFVVTMGPAAIMIYRGLINR